MRLFIYLSVYLFVCSCVSQKQTNIETYSKDVLVFEIQNNKTNIIYKENIYAKSNFIVALDEWMGGDGMDNELNRFYTFVQQNDTMSIECGCGQEINYYFKNLVFRSGNYKLTFEIPKKQILGNKILTSKKLQHMIFKNVYVSQEIPNFQNLPFKDIHFTLIDLQDSVNVKFERIDPNSIKDE